MRNQEKLIPTSYLRGIISYVPQPRIPFYWFTSSSSQATHLVWSIGSGVFILQGSHVQRQYQKWTTLRSKSSTIKGLLYAPERHNCKKGTLSDQPRLSRVSSTALLCCWGCSCSKMWRPLWLTLRCMPYGRGTLKARCEGFCSEEGPHYRFESVRKLSSDKQQSTYSRVWISFGDSIPGLYCVAWQSLTHARKCQFKDFCEKERYESCSVQRTFTADTFGKRRKRESSPVVSLLLGSRERLALRNPHVLCQKHGGACTMY
jgi:hypothetical protein